MTELEKRKKMLVAESEVYRETLKLEIQNFRIYGIQAKKRATSLWTYAPLLVGALPMVRALFVRKKRGFSFRQFGGLVLMGLQLYRRYGSVLRARRGVEAEKSQAEEYLSRRL